MIRTYLTVEYIAIVLFGLIMVLFSIGSVYLNIERDKFKKTKIGDIGYRSWKNKLKEYNKEEKRNER